MAEAAQGGGASTRLGGARPPKLHVCDATTSWAQLYAPKGGRHMKHTKRGAEVVVVRRPKLPTPVNQPKAPKKGHFGRWEIS